MRESIWISGQEHTKFPHLWSVVFLFCQKVRWLNHLTWLPVFLHWQPQHVRYIILISLDVWLNDTCVEDSLMKREGFSCLIEALVVPSVARSLSLTSSEQVQLRRQLCTLPCLTGIIGISFWPLPLSLPPPKCWGIQTRSCRANRQPHSIIIEYFSQILELIKIAQSLHILGDIYKFQYIAAAASVPVSETSPSHVEVNVTSHCMYCCVSIAVPWSKVHLPFICECILHKIPVFKKAVYCPVLSIVSQSGKSHFKLKKKQIVF